MIGCDDKAPNKGGSFSFLELDNGGLSSPTGRAVEPSPVQRERGESQFKVYQIGAPPGFAYLPPFLTKTSQVGSPLICHILPYGSEIITPRNLLRWQITKTPFTKAVVWNGSMMSQDREQNGW